MSVVVINAFIVRNTVAYCACTLKSTARRFVRLLQNKFPHSTLIEYIHNEVSVLSFKG